MCGGGGDGPGAPLWIVSFSDMVANLVTFFIILACFAGGESDSAKAVTKSGIGVHGTNQSTPLPELVQRAKASDASYSTEGPQTPSERAETALDEALDKLATPDNYDVKPDIETLESGLRIRLSTDGMFRPGSTSMTEHGLVLVREIGTFFRGESCEYVVEGHAELGDGDTLQSALERSMAMARGVARTLAGSGVEPFRVGVRPHGATAPLGPNDNAAGRKKNRRIEILVRRKS
ncbi:MAG: hypothetical protein EXS14_05370 [Planctomycetes bacterium]|nr:hypothetical protein [Planctomycetota bacterium]